MKKNKERALASATVASLVLTSMVAFANPVDVQAAEVNRLEGAGRIQTANSVAEKAFDTADTVILVNGWGYADAVSATPLSKQLNAPILLTQNGSRLEEDVKSTINRLGAKKVVIVGGTGVVSDGIKNELSSNYEVSRIAGTYDTTRMGTNAAVAEEVLKTSKVDTAVLVNGQDGYADALSVASVAAAKGYPVLFSKAGEVSETVKSLIESKGLKVLAVGGKGVLSEAAVNSVGGTRIAEGTDRFDTNLKVLNYFKDSLDLTNMYVAAGGRAGSTGRNDFADALVASAAAAKTGAPVVLSGLGAGSNQQYDAKRYIEDNKSENTNVTIVGGTGSVDSSVESDIRDVVNPEDTETTDENHVGVSNVEVLNLKQVKVTFDKSVNNDELKDKIEDESNYRLEDQDGDEINEDFIKEVTLDESGKFAIVTFNDIASDEDDYILENQENYKLSIDEEITEKGYEEELEFTDFEIPKVEDIKVIGKETIKVKFSEPVKPINISEISDSITDSSNSEKIMPILNEDSFEINDGDISVDRVELVNNNTEANVILSTDLKDKEQLEVKVKGTIDDYAGMGVVSQKANLTVEEDAEKPQIIGFKNIEKDEVTLIFNEDIRFKDKNNDNFYHTNESNESIDQIIDGNELTLKFDSESGLPAGDAYVNIKAEAIEDLWENENDKILFKVTRAEDNTRPEVVSVKQDDDDQNKIVVKFSEKLRYDEKDDDNNREEDWGAERNKNYVIEDKDGKSLNVRAVKYDTDNKEATLTMRDDELEAGETYKVTVKNVEDKEQNQIKEQTKEFKVEDKEAVKEDEVKAFYTESGRNNQKIVVDFDSKMLADGSRYAINDIDNYSIDFGGNIGEKLVSDLYGAKVKAVDDDHKLEITLPYRDDKDDSYDFNHDEPKEINITRISDSDGNKSAQSINVKITKVGSVTLDKAEAMSTDEIKVTLSDKVKLHSGDLHIYAGDNEIDNLKFNSNEDEDGNTVIKITIPDDENHGGDDAYKYDGDNPISYDGKYQGKSLTVKVEPEDAGDEIETENKYGAKLSGQLDVKDKISPVLIDDEGNNDEDWVKIINYDSTGDGTADVALKFREAINEDTLSNITFKLDDDSKYDNVKISDVTVSGEDPTIVLIHLANVEDEDGNLVIEPGFEITQRNSFEDANGNDVDGIDTEVGDFKAEKAIAVNISKTGMVDAIVPDGQTSAHKVLQADYTLGDADFAGSITWEIYNSAGEKIAEETGRTSDFSRTAMQWSVRDERVKPVADPSNPVFATGDALKTIWEADDTVVSAGEYKVKLIAYDGNSGIKVGQAETTFSLGKVDIDSAKHLATVSDKASLDSALAGSKTNIVLDKGNYDYSGSALSIDRAVTISGKDVPASPFDAANSAYINGDVTINKAGTTLKNVVVNGTITLDAGIADGDVTLENVYNPSGTLKVLAGGSASIHLKGNTNVGTLEVEDNNGNVRVVAEDGNVRVGNVDMKSGGKLEAPAGVFTGTVTVNVADLAKKGTGVTLAAPIAGKVTVTNTQEEALNIEQNVGEVEINVNKPIPVSVSATVGTLSGTGPATVTTSGEGAVSLNNNTNATLDGEAVNNMSVTIGNVGMQDALVPDGQTSAHKVLQADYALGDADFDGAITWEIYNSAGEKIAEETGRTSDFSRTAMQWSVRDERVKPVVDPANPVFAAGEALNTIWAADDRIVTAGEYKVKVIAYDADSNKVAEDEQTVTLTQENVDSAKHKNSDATVKKAGTAEAGYVIDGTNGTITGVPAGTVAELKADILVNDAKATLKVTDASDLEIADGTALATGQKVVVTAEDGTVKTYTITVVSNDATVKKAATAEAGYVIDGTNGTITGVPAGTVAELKADILVNDAKATLKVTDASDTEIADGTALATGQKVVVTAEDGTVKTYTITVVSNDATVKKAATAEAGYVIDGTNGTITGVPAGTVAELKADILVNDAKATLKVTDASDLEIADGATALATGQKVVVTAEDGTVKTYTITVTP